MSPERSALLDSMIRRTRKLIDDTEQMIRLAADRDKYAEQQAASITNEQELRRECERLQEEKGRIMDMLTERDAELVRLQSAAMLVVDDRERCAAVCDREANLFDGPGNSDIRSAIVGELRHAANTIRNLPSLPACQPVQQEAGIPHVRKDTTTSYFLAIGTNGHPLGHPRLFVTADAAETALRLEFGDDFRATKPPAVAEQETIPGGAVSEREVLQLIDERDESEEALSQAYFLVIGKSPEWSNCFHYPQAIEEIDDAQKTLRQTISKQDREIQALRETMQECAEKIRDLTSPDIPIESWSAWFGGFNSIADRLDAGHAEMANGG